MKLIRIDVFSKEWTSRFATPFPYIDNQIPQDFSCMEGVGAEKGYGYIRAIFRDYIQIINQDNRSLRFKLGTCTRLESTLSLPKTGMVLYWSGKPGKAYDEYLLFFGTII